MAALTLLINGKKQKLDVGPNTPLLYALREKLMINAPKYGCGLGQCGSCMVLIDGKAQPACLLTCESVEDNDILTLEGMGTDRVMDPVQQAFYDMQAAQCGFCTNGMIITAKELLERNANPSEQEIKESLNRVLCRCGAHARIIKAVEHAAYLKKLPLS